MRQEMDDSAEARRIRREARQRARRRQVFIQKIGIAAVLLLLIVLTAAAVRSCGRADTAMEEPQSEGQFQEGESLMTKEESGEEPLLAEGGMASVSDAEGTGESESVTLENSAEIESEAGTGTEPKETEGETEDVGTENTETEAPETETASAAGTTGIANVSDSLNIRREASEESTIIGQIPSGERCEILESGDPWYRIRFGEMEGFVNGQYLLIE